MRHTLFTGIRENKSLAKCHGMKFLNFRKDIQKLSEIYEAAVSVVYESPSGSMICLDYTYMQQGAANIIAPGDDEILDVTVNGIQGQFFLPHDPADAKTITWIDADSNLQFVVKAFCSETDILHIAESVSLVKTEK